MKNLLVMLLLLFLSAGCSSTAKRKWVPTVQRTPSDLRIGSYPEKVRKKMGHPSEIEEKPDGREIWTYRDLWHDDRSWGSWKLYFNSNFQLTGWKMIDPPSNQEFNRSAFFDLSP